MNEFEDDFKENENIQEGDYWKIKDLEMRLHKKSRCMKCNCYFPNCGLKNHFKVCQGPKDDTPICKEYKCCFCGAIFDTPQKSGAHRVKCKENPDRKIFMGKKPHKNPSTPSRYKREVGVHHAVIKTKEGDVLIVIREDF